MDSLEQELNIRDLNLSRRAYNCLKRNSIDTVEKLIDVSDEELISFRNLGVKTFDEIKSVKTELMLNGWDSISYMSSNYSFVKVNNTGGGTLLDSLIEVGKEVDFILFETSESLRQDLKIEELNFSNYSTMVLRDFGIDYGLQLLSINLSKFEEIVYTDDQKDVINKLESILFIRYKDENDNKVINSTEIFDLLCSEFSANHIQFNRMKLRIAIKKVLKDEFGMKLENKKVQLGTIKLWI